MRVRYNAPTSLTFSLCCLIVFLLGRVFVAFAQWFVVPGAGGLAWGEPLQWLRLISHVLGHGSWDHLFGNLSFILLLGPILEEKYGSRPLLWMILVTAAITGLLNALLFSSSLLGASGIVFMFILLSSITNIREGEIPLTFLLVVVIFLLREVVDGLQQDQVSQFAHLLGGICGGFFGLTTLRRQAPELKTTT